MKNGFIAKTSTIVFSDGAYINISIVYYEGSQKKVVETNINVKSLSEMAILENIFGVADWEHINGAPIRFSIENDKVTAIGNFCEDDKILNLMFVEEKTDTENSVEEKTETET